MSMQPRTIPSGRARKRRNAVAIAVGAAVALLVILALLGANPLALAVVGLLSLGSTLIFTDRAARIESDSYTLLV
jgi:Flp pilus assembly protein TadB